MFDHNNTLENPMYQQKATIYHQIYEVSRPARKSFHGVTRPGRNNAKLLGKLQYISSQLSHLTKCSVPAEIPHNTVLSPPRYLINILLDYPFDFLMIIGHTPTDNNMVQRIHIENHYFPDTSSKSLSFNRKSEVQNAFQTAMLGSTNTTLSAFKCIAATMFGASNKEMLFQMYLVKNII